MSLCMHASWALIMSVCVLGTDLKKVKEIKKERMSGPFGTESVDVYVLYCTNNVLLYCTVCIFVRLSLINLSFSLM